MRKLLFAGLFVLLASSSSAIDYISDTEHAIIKHSKKNDALVLELEGTIKRLENTMDSMGRTIKQQMEENRAQVADLIAQEKCLEKLRNRIIDLTKPEILKNLAEGFTGQLKVGQRAYISPNRAFKIDQITDGQNMIVEIKVGRGTQQVWMKGISTRGLADDIWATSKAPFHITGTKAFTTVAGSQRTVFLIEPIKVDSWEGDYSAIEMATLSVADAAEIRKLLTATRKSTLAEFVQACQNDGWVTDISKFNEVFVEVDTWNVMPAGGRKRLAEAFAEFCGNENDYGKWVEIKDSRTGVKLARFGAAGFKQLKRAKR